MKKVLVIGSGGSGKSTLARVLGTTLGLDVLHLDKLYWKAGWVEPSKDEWLATLEQVLTRDTWVMDGNFGGTLNRRIEACDTIVFLDLSRLVCVVRIIKRRFRYRSNSRPDMAEGCHERLNLEFLHWVWNYPRRSRPKVVRMIEENKSSKKIVWLKSRRDVNAFLKSLTLN